MTPTDVALLDEAHWLIDPGFRRFGHVVVDEAQNLTPMELRMTVRRARGQSLTILGDLSQRTADAGVSSWDAVLDEAGVDEHACQRAARQLPRAERVPRDRRARCCPPGAPAPRGRARGAVPAGGRAHRRPRRRRRAREARAAADEVGSVGIVAPRACLDDVRGALAGVDVRRRDPRPLGPGINLLDLHVAKGLEFDAIVVVEPAAILAERPDGGVGGLYTALTRATRALAIVHADAPSFRIKCCGQILTAIRS